MFENKTEGQAREEILAFVEEYYEKFHQDKQNWQEGQRFRSGVAEADVVEWVNGLNLQ